MSFGLYMLFQFTLARLTLKVEMILLLICLKYFVSVAFSFFINLSG